MDKSEYLAKMEEARPDLMWPESWNEEKRMVAHKELKGIDIRSQMLKAIPMLCKGDKCPQKSFCPLYAKGVAPVGMRCPIEINLISEMKDALVESLQIDEKDFTEVSQMRAIIDQEIQMIRKSNFLAEEGFIMENVVGVSENGEPIMKKELALSVELEDRIHKRLKEYRSQLLATREAKAKVMQGEINSTKTVASILAEIHKVQELKEQKMQKELGIYVEDEYVTDAEVIEDV